MSEAPAVPASEKSEVTAASVAPEAPKDELRSASVIPAAPKDELRSASVIPAAPKDELRSASVIPAAPKDEQHSASVVPSLAQTWVAGTPEFMPATAATSMGPGSVASTRPSSSKPSVEPVTSPALPSNIKHQSASSIPVAGSRARDSQSPRPNAAISDAQTSMSPLIAEEELPAVRRKPQLWLFVAAAAIVVGGIWGAKGGKLAAKAPRKAAVAAMNQPPAQKAAPEEKAAHLDNGKEESKPVSAAPPANSESPEAAPPPTNGPERPAALASAAPSASATDSGDSAPQAGYNRVKVEIFPIDSTVAVQGKEVKGPLVFDVIKGSRTILEVAHPGYVTRRIVLDGKKGFVRIAMKPAAIGMENP
jgi:hypothetical protein